MVGLGSEGVGGACVPGSRLDACIWRPGVGVSRKLDGGTGRMDESGVTATHHVLGQINTDAFCGVRRQSLEKGIIVSKWSGIESSNPSFAVVWVFWMEHAHPRDCQLVSTGL
jgi:hypothetical protein